MAIDRTHSRYIEEKSTLGLSLMAWALALPTS